MDVLQAVRGRDDLRAVLAVEVEARIVLALAPGVVDRFRRRGERRRERDDRAGIEVAIGPSVESLADTRRERVVDRGMTQRASHADARERIFAVDAFDRSFQADNRIEFQQRDRRIRTRQADAAVLDPRDDRSGERFRIHLQSDRQRGGGIDRAANDLMYTQGIGPLSLVAEGVETATWGGPDSSIGMNCYCTR